MSIPNYTNDVFINCPFDSDYRELFHALVFAVFDCNFRARCALEEDDGGEVRMVKILKIVEQCKYGIHDISRTELDITSNLPRFNMPFELGIFIGAKKLGTTRQKEKKCMIMDREQYRYQSFISDIAGHDIKGHNNDPVKVINLATDWLRNASGRVTIPGGRVIANRYNEFNAAFPAICNEADIEEDEVGFNEYSTFVSAWILENLR